MRTASNIARHELIGLDTVAVSPDGRETEGRVIDETRNMLVIEAESSEKRIPKEHTVFRFFLPETKEWVRVEGRVLIARPEDRIKKRLEKW